MTTESSHHRIVSLIASATELVHALGYGGQQVGRSHECDFPVAVESLPICSEPKLDIKGDSKQIDDRVKAVLETDASVYRVFQDVLEDIQPSLIITQSHCDVCAVNLEDVEAALAKGVSSHPDVVALAPNKLSDIYSDITRLGVALNDPAAAKRLIDHIQGGLDDVASKVPTGSRPRVACVEWIEPIMMGGNWVPELVNFAGGLDVLGKVGEHSGYISAKELHDADPDVVLVIPCGWGIEKGKNEMHFLESQAEFTSMRAVKAGDVFICDGNHYFNRPGPRLLESTQIIAEILGYGDYGLSHAWERWKR